MNYKVYNWQINRKMDYKYPESRPQKQVAWIFDTNKCIACQTFTVACKNAWTARKGQEFMWWNNVESKPWVLPLRVGCAASRKTWTPNLGRLQV